jgi:predicted permease
MPDQIRDVPMLVILWLVVITGWIFIYYLIRKFKRERANETTNKKESQDTMSHM